MRQLRVLPLIATLLLAVLALSAHASDLEQHLRGQYRGKTLLLRGFYSGDRLRYDSAGAATSGAHSGDWTTEGLILVSDIHVSDLRLMLKAKRLSVVVSPKGTFQFLAETPKAQKKATPLQIEVELPQVNPSFEQVNAILSKLFLTAQDSFAELVPDYWKPCVPDGLSGKVSKCFFSPEFGAIPGFGPRESSDAASSGKGTPPPADMTAVPRDPSNGPVAHVGHGVSPPKVISQHEPEFTESARKAKFQGMVTLGLIVNKEGLPTNIHIMSPLGCGLDAKAVQAVETWRFKPAEKDGEPVRVVIAVEVDFHLY
jgi:TonB family protein